MASPSLPATTRKPPPPWIFALTYVPYGVVGSFSGQVMPYLTRRADIEVDSIGWFGSLLLVPAFLQFLYAPVVDVGPRRKHWLLIVAALAGACLVGACSMPLPDNTVAFLALAFAAAVLSGLTGACNGGLITTMIPDHLRGRTAGWQNIGNLSGGAISAAIVIFMTSREVDPTIIGLVLAAMMILPALAILVVDEPLREARRTIAEVFRSTWRDVGAVISTRRGASGILLCLSPVGTCALVNYFSAFQPDYNVSDDALAFVQGPANAVLTAVGAFIGGYLCDRHNRRVLYLLAGILTASCGLAMVISPRVEETYIAGVLVYTLITGFAYSAWSATVFETIGVGGASASTQYSLFSASGNAAITYVGLVDTRFHERHGVEGVIAADATLNIVAVVIMAFVFYKLKSFGKSEHPPAPLPQAAPSVPTARVVTDE